MDQSLFAKYQLATTTRKTERGELLKEFMENINIARKGTPYKPLSITRVSMYLPKEIPTKDLYTLLSKCKDAGNRSKNYHQGFSKCFFYEIKAQ